MKTPSISQWFVQSRLPKSCRLCSQYHAGLDAICAPCHAFLTPIITACTSCSRPLPDGHFMTCGECIKKKPYFDNVFAPYLFEEPLRTLLHEFKYQKGLYLLSFLANLIIQHQPPHADQTECLIPVPMHPRRLRHRGFNQAALLAKWIGKALNIPCQVDACQKIRHTLPQAALNATQRRHNLKQSFQNNAFTYQRVTLIDDLITTGSTVNELAKTLKQQGVEHVSVWCCARVSMTIHDQVLSTINRSR